MPHHSAGLARKCHKTLFFHPLMHNCLRCVFLGPEHDFSDFFPKVSAKPGSDPFYLSKKLRRRRYGEVSAQTSQKSQNRALKKKKSCVPCACGASMYPTTWTINRTFSKSEILAESLDSFQKKKKNSVVKKLGSKLCYRLLVYTNIIFF